MSYLSGNIVTCTPWSAGGIFSAEEIDNIRDSMSTYRQMLSMPEQYKYKCQLCRREESEGIDSEEPEDKGKRRQESTVYKFRLLSFNVEDGSTLRLSFSVDNDSHCNHPAPTEEELAEALPSAEQVLAEVRSARRSGRL